MTRISEASRLRSLGLMLRITADDGAPSMPMPLIPEIAVFQRKLATLPVVTYQAGPNRSAGGHIRSNRRMGGLLMRA